MHRADLFAHAMGLDFRWEECLYDYIRSHQTHDQSGPGILLFIGRHAKLVASYAAWARAML